MSDPATVISTALQQKGHRLTAARRAIVNTLIDQGGHLSADELVILVQRNTPGVGRMTVYRTLDLLAELGLIRPVYQGSGAAHYVIMDGGHHHHLVCSNCAGVFEFDECALEEVAHLVGQRHHFQVQGHLLEFFGLCQQCQEGRG
ncbi:MAG: Fur family transcriptional regulator [Chloroflexota bacterium]